MINFSSENYDHVHPSIMQALLEANQGFATSYGKDDDTSTAIEFLRREFGEKIEVHFTFNGTGANNFALGCLAQRHQSIFCSDIAHFYVDESTAPEAFIGCRLYSVNSEQGKINVDSLSQQVKRIGDLHHPQPGVVTLTQPTEYGTVYSIAELQAIKTFCSMHNLLLHVDGARFFNAAVSLKVSLKELSTQIGIDALTLGGTKIGMMFGEAVIFFGVSKPNHFWFMHKRSMQLASKNRFIAIQFAKLFENSLWMEIANYTNQLAKYFENQVKLIAGVQIVYPVQSNVVFLTLPKWLYLNLQVYTSFYYWDEQKEYARLVFSFSNTKQEVIEFIELLVNRLEYSPLEG
ncbi:MAG: aminotransferase class I/II-fold pyridoxal phosphate-dependent enzyme [Pedobacter sp.]|jgi:threonine aldolase|uniref:threonine aldolase family protein n=1 Tax=Pedobacter sp. TaxID=1411316 RepID=UPI003565923E